MDVELVARLRGVIGRLARQLNDTSTGEGLPPTQYSVLGLVRGRGSPGLAELTEMEGLNPTMLCVSTPHNVAAPASSPLASSTTEKATGSACGSVTRNGDSGGTGRHGR